jgi:hypothetical protein
MCTHFNKGKSYYIIRKTSIFGVCISFLKNMYVGGKLIKYQCICGIVEKHLRSKTRNETDEVL